MLAEQHDDIYPGHQAPNQGNLHRLQCVQEYAFTFDADLSDLPGDRLGLDTVFVKCPRGFGLVVRRILPGGRIEAWNGTRQGPFSVHPGDFVVMVNGILGDESELVRVLRTGAIRSLRFQREVRGGIGREIAGRVGQPLATGVKEHEPINALDFGSKEGCRTATTAAPGARAHENGEVIHCILTKTEEVGKSEGCEYGLDELGDMDSGRVKPSKLRPCKGKRARYRKLVAQLQGLIAQDPDNFDIMNVDLPPHILQSEVLQEKLRAKMQVHVDKAKADRAQAKMAWSPSAAFSSGIGVPLTGEVASGLLATSPQSASGALAQQTTDARIWLDAGMQ